MTVIDYILEFCEDKAITSKGTTLVTPRKDLGSGYDAFGSAQISIPGRSRGLMLNIFVTTKFTGAAASATLKARLVQATAAASATYTLVQESAEYTPATLVAGYKMAQWPLAITSLQYLALQFVVGVTNMTAGKVSAWIGLDSEMI